MSRFTNFHVYPGSINKFSGLAAGPREAAEGWLQTTTIGNVFR